MRSRNKFLSVGAVVAAALLSVVVLSSEPAYASTQNAYYAVSWMGDGDSSGYFTWYNRTAAISEDTLHNAEPYSCVEAVFVAYAGTTKIDTVVDDFCGTDTTVTFYNEPIGDTNLVGGINRIKVTVCNAYYVTGSWLCGTPVNVMKPA